MPNGLNKLNMEVPVILKDGVIAVLSFRAHCVWDKEAVEKVIKEWEEQYPEIVEECKKFKDSRHYSYYDKIKILYEWKFSGVKFYLDPVMQNKGLELTLSQFQLITNTMFEKQEHFYKTANEHFD